MSPNYDETVEKYAAAMKVEASFPPVVVFKDEKGVKWLADGHCRCESCILIRRKTIMAEVRPGTQSDAQWYSFSANQLHGLNRKPSDIENTVKGALRHPNGVKMANGKLATHVGVSPKTVAKYRKEMEATREVPESESRQGADGRTINTTNIGTKPKRNKPGTKPKRNKPGTKPKPADDNADERFEMWLLNIEPKINALEVAAELLFEMVPDDDEDGRYREYIREHIRNLPGMGLSLTLPVTPTEAAADGHKARDTEERPEKNGGPDNGFGDVTAFMAAWIDRQSMRAAAMSKLENWIEANRATPQPTPPVATTTGNAAAIPGQMQLFDSTKH